MLGDLNGPQLLILIAVVIIIIGALVAWLIIATVKRSGRARQQELQQAYEAGRNSSP